MGIGLNNMISFFEELKKWDEKLRNFIKKARLLPTKEGGQEDLEKEKVEYFRNKFSFLQFYLYWFMYKNYKKSSLKKKRKWPIKYILVFFILLVK